MLPSVLRAMDVSWRPAGAAAPVLDGVTASLERGELVALLGDSGCGKSTLLQCLAGLLAPTAGRVLLDDDRTPTPASVALVFQNPDHQFVAARLDRELAFGLEVCGVPRAAQQAAVARAAESLGFAGRLADAPAALSAGERQRLALAAAGIADPAFLLADEPTSHLDWFARAAVMRLLRARVRDGCGVLFVTPFPDEALAADRVWVLDAGRVRDLGAPGPALCRRDRTPHSDAARLAAAAASGGAEIPVEVRGPRDLAMFWRPSASAPATLAPPAEPAAELRGVTCRRNSGPPALAVDFLALAPGDRAIVAGPSASGKTTLLHVLAGVLQHEGVRRLSTECAARVGLLGQSPERMFYRSTAWDELGVGRSADVGRAEALVRALGLDPAAVRRRAAFHFSVGEQRRLAVAAQILRGPRLLLLDEPTAGLDPAASAAVCEAILAQLPPEAALVVATHDLGLTAALGTRFLRLSGGRVTEHPSLRDLIGAIVAAQASHNPEAGHAPEHGDGFIDLLPAWWQVAEHIVGLQAEHKYLLRSELDVIRGLRAPRQSSPALC